MAIVRVKHDKSNPYVMINKDSLWDKNLSLEAVGLWARLLSRPDNWQISASELAKSCAVGIKKIYSLLQELIKNGYASRTQEISKGVKGFGKVSYEIFEFKNILTLGHLELSIGTRSTGEDTTNKEDNQVHINTNPPLPPPKEDLIPTKEEEEEIEKRFKERPPGSKKIGSRKAWNREVLKDLREESSKSKHWKKMASKHKLEALVYDMTVFNGMNVFCCPGHVEFTKGSYIKEVKYDMSDDQWYKETGFKK